MTPSKPANISHCDTQTEDDRVPNDLVAIVARGIALSAKDGKPVQHLAEASTIAHRIAFTYIVGVLHVRSLELLMPVLDGCDTVDQVRAILRPVVEMGDRVDVALFGEHEVRSW